MIDAEPAVCSQARLESVFICFNFLSFWKQTLLTMFNIAQSLYNRFVAKHPFHHLSFDNNSFKQLPPTNVTVTLLNGCHHVNM